MIVGLGGGIGASRLWTGLSALVEPSDLTIIVNTADDFTHRGLRICPDLDTTLYGLAGIRDVERGWGLAGETWRAAERLRALGGEPWFNLGDQDLATHLFRSGLRVQGVRLSEITARLAHALGVSQRVLPMCDTDVETWVTTQAGESMHYQEYLVRNHCSPPLTSAGLRGAALALPAPGVVEALHQARVIILAPSNPAASIRPILSLPRVRQAIANSKALRIAVTPTVYGVPITDPGEKNRARSRERLLALDGIAHRASAIAGLYRELIDVFVLDQADRQEQSVIEDMGISALLADTLIPQQAKSIALARRLLALSRTPA